MERDAAKLHFHQSPPSEPHSLRLDGTLNAGSSLGCCLFPHIVCMLRKGFFRWYELSPAELPTLRVHCRLCTSGPVALHPLSLLFMGLSKKCTQREREREREMFWCK